MTEGASHSNIWTGREKPISSWGHSCVHKPLRQERVEHVPQTGQNCRRWQVRTIWDEVRGRAGVQIAYANQGKKAEFYFRCSGKFLEVLKQRSDKI